MNITISSVMVVHADKSETPLPPDVYEIVGGIVRFVKFYHLAEYETIAVYYSIAIEGLPPHILRGETTPALTVYDASELSINWREGVPKLI